MPLYTFTPSKTFALGTHEVTFTDTNIIVKVTSSGLTVYNGAYASGIAFRCVNNDFQVGTLSCSSLMTKVVNLSLTDAALWLEEKWNNNAFIGANDSSDDSVYNLYNINQCPVLLSKEGNNAIMKCPCEGSPCSNKCYQYGV